MSNGGTKSTRPVIAATIGDPAGIGPEVCVKALATGVLDELCRPVLIGDAEVVHHAARIGGVTRPIRAIRSIAELDASKDSITVLDPGGFAPANYTIGQSSLMCGEAVLGWLETGRQLGVDRAIAGLVWGPVNSDSLMLTGRIQHIDDLQPPATFMLRVSGALRVVPITEHIRVRDIPATVTTARVLELVALLHRALQDWGIRAPRIAVAGLNPHAMFDEDKQEVAPAVAAARQAGIDAYGPIAPDSVFRLAADGRYDAVVTMYHDQGQIAVKTLAFEGACTIFLGLPYVLVGVPHGSAFDIAGTGKAQHSSMLAAMKTAADLAGGRGFAAAEGIG
jgi:4-hydroxy-L-threonine phosphate dehydrogenase PdxA